MTSRERILSALRREPVDSVPCHVSFFPLHETLRRGHSWNFPWPPEASRETQIACQVERLGLDTVVSVGANLCRPAPDVTVKTWLDAETLHKAYETPAGRLHACVRYTENWPHGQDIPFYSDFNVGHFVEPWIETEEDLECLRHVVRLCDTKEVLQEARQRIEEGKRIAEGYRLATMGAGGLGLTGAQHLFGATELCLMTIESPDLVDAYMEHEHKINLRTIELLGECGVDILARNGFYETADFYGPDMLRHFVAPRVNREAEAAHAAGMLCSYTAHTGVAPILSYLAELGVDAIFGIDIAFGDLDLPKTRDTLCESKSLWIGPSSVFHLAKGPEVTREAVRKVFAVFGREGLILTPCVSAHSTMPWESTLAMIEEWKRLR